MKPGLNFASHHERLLYYTSLISFLLTCNFPIYKYIVGIRVGIPVQSSAGVCRLFTMAPVYGWKQPSSAPNSNVIIKPSGDVFAEDINSRLKKSFLTTLCRRPTVGLTEVILIKFMMMIC